MITNLRCIRALRFGVLIAVLLLVGVLAASAETLMMPNRPMLRNTSEVVWGITTQPNGTAFTLSYGDGTPDTTGPITDRSYIAFNHSYATAGTFTATLTVGAESATATITVYDPATTSAFDLRNVNIKRAIENGLRYLWTSQNGTGRQNFDTVPTTSWGNFPGSFTALTVLAYENQQYLLPNNDTVPTGLYQKYAVQRGLNYLASIMANQALNAQTNGDPCVVLGTTTSCTGLVNNVDGDQGYSTALILLPFAGSTALSRHMGTFGPTLASGQTYGNIVKNLTATIAWGQIDACNGRGGWHYGLNNNGCDTSDGSTDGWDLLALLDSVSSGVTIPPFVKSEWTNFALLSGLNNDGSFDYNSDGNPASDNNVNLAKAGVALQGFFYGGYLVGDPKVQQTLSYINTHWTNFTGFGFSCGNGAYNLGCSYGMFNLFKGLKLFNIQTIANSPRPAGPGTIAASDWYAEYVDYLINNQTAPTSTSGGYWSTMSFSCCTDNTPANAAIAELILSPVALIQPNPTLFASVGLSPATSTNAPGTSHTVTATALSAPNAPVPGVTINFIVQTGPNAGKTGTGTTNAQGQTTFTYTDTSTGPYPKTDTIQAFIGPINTGLPSNIVSKTWSSVLACDVNADGQVDNRDIAAITAARGRRVAAGDPRDYDHDGIISINDARACVLKCTKAGCAQ